MKKIDLFIAAILAIVIMIGSAGCAGTTYSTAIPTQNGTLTVGGRTGVFGTDQGFTLYEENKPAKPAPDKLTLQKAWSRQATIQEYDQKCPNPNQLKNIHTRTENVAESWQEEVPNPHKRAPQTQLIGGTNPSTGNLAVPAAIQGAGSYFSGGTTNMIQGGASAMSKATGGKASGGTAYGGQGGKGGNSINTNTNVNPNTNVNGNTNGNANGNANSNGNNN